MKMIVSFLISGTSLSDHIRQSPYLLFPVRCSLSVHGTESILKAIRTSWLGSARRNGVWFGSSSPGITA